MMKSHPACLSSDLKKAPLVCTAVPGARVAAFRSLIAEVPYFFPVFALGETPSPQPYRGERGGGRSGPPWQKPWKKRDGSSDKRRDAATRDHPRRVTICSSAHLFTKKKKGTHKECPYAPPGFTCRPVRAPPGSSVPLRAAGVYLPGLHTPLAIMRLAAESRTIRRR